MVNMARINGRMTAIRSMSLEYADVIKYVSGSVFGVKVTYKDAVDGTPEIELKPGQEVLLKPATTVIVVHN